MIPKREQLEHLVCNSNIDFMGLSETWLTNFSKAAIVLPGYKTVRKDREQWKGGGVLLYIRDTLKCNQTVWPSDINLECVGVNISLSNEMSHTVICIYRKPSAKNYFYDHLKTLLKSCNHKREIILSGDFNINWDDKKDRKNLKSITDLFNLVQLIDQPTRITNCS